MRCSIRATQRSARSKPAVAGMYYQAEVLEPIAGDAVGMNDVADIDQIGLEQLIERPGRVSSELQRRATS